MTILNLFEQWVSFAMPDKTINHKGHKVPQRLWVAEISLLHLSARCRESLRPSDRKQNELE